MMDKIPKDILEGWARNRRFIECLELFQIQNLDQESIILLLGINTPSYSKSFEKIKERNGKETKSFLMMCLSNGLISQVKNEVFEFHQDF